jgi:hypothetical protein
MTTEEYLGQVMPKNDSCVVAQAHKTAKDKTAPQPETNPSPSGHSRTVQLPCRRCTSFAFFFTLSWLSTASVGPVGSRSAVFHLLRYSPFHTVIVLRVFLLVLQVDLCQRSAVTPRFNRFSGLTAAGRTGRFLYTVPKRVIAWRKGVDQAEPDMVEYRCRSG